MNSRLSLRGFLRQEVKRSRIKVKPKSSQCRSMLPPPPGTPPPPSPLSSLFRDDSVRESSASTGSSSTRSDSLFGDGVYEEEMKVIQTKKERRQEQLKKLITEQDQMQHSFSKTKSFDSPELEALKKGLETLLTRELEASWEQKVGIRSQKIKLIEEIASIESENTDRKAKKLKVHLDQTVGVLPEPIGVGEKRTLKWQAERISKARAGLETSPQKRRRENLDHDLDGEDRLRLGKPCKKRVDTQIIGHWKRDIHDYFPDADGNGEIGKLEHLTAAEKQFLRRELAELGEKLANAERKKKWLGE